MKTSATQAGSMPGHTPRVRMREPAATDAVPARRSDAPSTIERPNVERMRRVVEDLARPNPTLYWADFTLSAVLAWVVFCFAPRVLSTSHSVYWSLVFVGSIGLYRALAFTHELVHLKRGSVPGLHLAWHLACGLPLLVPHFLYRAVHKTHHSTKHYGKREDGEYLEFGTRSRALIAVHLLHNFLLPVLSVLRFSIIAPLSLFHPRLRTHVVENMSFMGLRFSHRRPLPLKRDEKVEWYAQEVSCFVWCWTSFALLVTEMMPVIYLFQWYATMVSILTLNSLRTLAATHGYVSKGQSMNFSEQLHDSVSITSTSTFTKIFCPTGTQYHALHHMFPFLPYHSLRKAHERLTSAFPNEEILRKTAIHSLFVGWKRALRLR